MASTGKRTAKDRCLACGKTRCDNPKQCAADVQRMKDHVYQQLSDILNAGKRR